MSSPQPIGIAFFDGRSQRRLILCKSPGHQHDGWLFYQHDDGWRPLRKADGRDLLAMQQATRDQTMDETSTLPRTPEEIVARIAALANPDEGDLFGVERSRLLESLPWDEAQQFLNPGQTDHTPDTWEVNRTKDSKSVLAQLRGYLEFAWQKANDARGLSAQRSMSHFKGLLWLLGGEHDELREWIGSAEHYQFYGKPALVRLSELVGYKWTDADNDEWRNSEEEDAVTADEALGRG